MEVSYVDTTGRVTSVPEHHVARSLPCRNLAWGFQFMCCKETGEASPATSVRSTQVGLEQVDGNSAVRQQRREDLDGPLDSAGQGCMGLKVCPARSRSFNAQ